MTSLTQRDAVPLSYQQQMRLRRDVASLEAHGRIQDHSVLAAYAVGGDFDLRVFEQACRDVLVRHPGLAIAYSLDGGVPETGHLLDPEAFTVDGPEQTAAGVDPLRVSAFAPEGFKFRVTWTPPAETSRAGRLVLSVDHIAIDGNSWTTLLRDLSCAYDLRRQGRQLPGRGDAVAYSRYAAEQRESLAPEVIEKLLSYWRSRLDPLIPFGEEVMAGAVRPPAGPRTARQARYRFDLDLRATARAVGLTPFSLVMAAHAAVRYARSGRSVVTTHLSADLRGPTYADSVGWFSGGLVVRHRVDVDSTLPGLGAALLGTVFEAVDHAVPMAILLQELEPQRLQSGHWRPMCFIDVRDADDDRGLELAGCTVAEIDDEPSMPGLRDGVACWFTSAPPYTDVMVQFEAEAWSDDAARTFVADLEYIFERLVRDDLRTVADFSAEGWPSRRRPHHEVTFS